MNSYPKTVGAAEARARWLETQIMRVDWALGRTEGAAAQRLEAGRQRLQAEYDVLYRALSLLGALLKVPLCVGCGKISHFSQDSASRHAQALMVVGKEYHIPFNVYRCQEHLGHWHVGHARYSPENRILPPWEDPSFLDAPMDVWAEGQRVEHGAPPHSVRWAREENPFARV